MPPHMPCSTTTYSAHPRHPARCVAPFFLLLSYSLWGCAADPPTGPTITLDVGQVIEYLGDLGKKNNDQDSNGQEEPGEGGTEEPGEEIGRAHV